MKLNNITYNNFNYEYYSNNYDNYVPYYYLKI